MTDTNSPKNPPSAARRWWSSCSSRFSSRLSARAWRAPPPPSASASGASWTSATAPSPPPAGRRPSFYLLAFSALLLTSGAVGLLGGEEKESTRAAELEARGWRPWEGSLPCPAGAPGAFFELESEDDSLEAWRAGASVLVSRPLTPGATYRCRGVPGPTFTQEIL